MDHEWDPRKAKANVAKHGVRFEEAASVFLDAGALTFPDPDHSAIEEREITIGISESGRIQFVAHVARDDRMRIISARRATSHEQKQYEEGLR